MLLFDPEHLTAANFRKRRLLALRDVGDMAEFLKCLHKELCFVDSILTSPLHRQTKSPTLWYYRSFLLRLLTPLELESASGTRIATLISAALDTACKSADRHPGNYYAWQYARRMLLALSDIATEVDAPFPIGWVVSAFSDKVCAWCFQHPSDISGWSYLLFLLVHLDPVDERDEIVNKVLQWASKVKSENEALWFFVRNALARPTLLADHEALLQMLQESYDESSATDPDSGYSQHMKHSLLWIDTGGKWKTVF